MANVFDAKRIVVEYYERIKSTSIVNGYTKHIATNGTDVLIVESHFNEPSCWLFKCETRNSETYCELVN